MKKILLATITLAAILGVSVSLSGIARQAEDPGVLLRAAMEKEEVEGDLQGAIALYKQIVAKHSAQSAVAAKAQLHIGMCYEKLGNAEAVKAYEAVLSRFPKEAEAVAEARARLTALRKEEPTGPTMSKLLPPEIYLECKDLSRDGTKVAGIDFSKGQNVAVYDLATGKLTLITRLDWESAMTFYPLFSPDGKEVAYYWFQASGATELRVSTLDGKARTLYRPEKGRDIIPCDWFSDGSAIVVLIQRDEKTWTLGLIPPEGGEFKALRDVDYPLESIGTLGTRPASASPDGRFIVFGEGPQGKRDIVVIARDGKTVGNLTSHPADDGQGFWSPDGKYVVFKSNRSGCEALWGVAVKDGKPAAQPFLIKPGMENTMLLNWTARGLACEDTVDQRDVFVMPVDPKTGEPAAEARLVDYAPTGANFSPVWSPDGKFLAFMSSRDEYYLVVMPASGGKAREYLLPVGHHWGTFWFKFLRWLPDSSGLGFVTNFPLPGEKEFRLFQLDLKSGELKSWPFPWTNAGTWGRDGNSYIYAKMGEGLVERDLSTGEERSFYMPEDKKPMYFRDLKFSRDFEHLRFWNGDGEHNDLVVLNVKTGKSKIVDSGFIIAAWSPDGKLILGGIASPGQTTWPKKMFVLPADGGTPKELDLGGHLPAGCMLRNLDWSPDGKQIAFDTRVFFHETILLNHIIPEDKK
jgi:Tol biopolymer transport system component